MTPTIIQQFQRPCGDNANYYGWLHHYYLLRDVLECAIFGEIVELGCYKGDTACFLRTVAEDFCVGFKQLHVYDSFQGMPQPTAKDHGTFQWLCREGQLKASPEDVNRTFDQYGQPRPIIHPGWFKDTIPQELPDRICYAHLDGDFYESILLSLQGVYPRLSPGAVCVIDDWEFSAIPGATRAVTEFMADKPEKVEPRWGSVQGFFVKQ